MSFQIFTFRTPAEFLWPVFNQTPISLSFFHAHRSTKTSRAKIIGRSHLMKSDHYYSSTLDAEVLATENHPHVTKIHITGLPGHSTLPTPPGSPLISSLSLFCWPLHFTLLVTEHPGLRHMYISSPDLSSELLTQTLMT